MKYCKVCKVTESYKDSQLKLDVNSSLSSRKVAERWGVFSKSAINNHRANCDPTRIIMPTKEDLQSIEWSGDSGVLNTGSIKQSLSGMNHEEILRLFGHSPNEVEISGLLRERHSQYWSRDMSEMLWKHTYSFALLKKQPTTEQIDPIKLIKELGLKSRPVQKLPEASESTFVLDWADWQTGKEEGGGTPAFVQRFDGALSDAIQRIKELRKIGRGLSELVIIGGGDMIEGCTIYPNQSFHLDMHRRDQIRFTVATILRAIHELAPMFERVRVVVAPGNHGENRINGKRTSIGDNDDLLVFEMAEVGLSNDPNMKHVSFEIAQEEESITTEVRGWVYGVTHGSVYGRGAGNVRNKVFNWFRTMSANRHPVGASDVLVTHHFHHDASEDWGQTLWVQSPAMDGGSNYFKELTGHTAKSGMLSWVVTPKTRFQDKQILG